MKSIMLEVRPRLQSCYVFICTKKSLDSKKIEINLNEPNIMLRIDDQKYNFTSKNLKILPDSLSSLTISSNWISFRIQTKPFDSTFGSFKSEIIKGTSIACDVLHNAIKSNEMQLQGKECTISCAGCKHIISNAVSFQRVLPLPDMDYSPNEWFCCTHEHGKNNYLISPQSYECFYSPLYKILNKTLFNGNIKIDGVTVSCKQCHIKLGSIYKADALKLWNCCVQYKSTKNLKLISGSTNLLNDFLIAFQNSVNNLCGEEIIFEASVDEETHYLLVKPMDFKLELLIQPKVMTNTDVITLESAQVVKILYKHKTDKSTEKVQTANLTYCELPYPVLSTGLDYLLSSTERLPPVCRIADDYHIGHINLQDCTI